MEQQTLLSGLDSKPWDGIQSRYVAYCKAHGAASPEEMLARDRERNPCGAMGEFCWWIQAKWREWRQAANYHGPLSQEHHEAFDEWLDNPAKPAPTPTQKEQP